MAEVNPPLYVETNDAYGADELGLPFRDIMGEGIVGANDLLVTANVGLKTSVAAGAAWIKGDDDANAQPTYRVRNDAAVLLNHAAADPTNPRIDLVIAEVLDAGFAGVSRLWRLRVVQGVAAGVPAAPATPSDAIALAEVRINAGSGTITSVTDKRTLAKVGAGAAAVAASPGYLVAPTKKTSNGTVSGTTAETDILNGVTIKGGTIGPSGAIRIKIPVLWNQNTGGTWAPPAIKVYLGAVLIGSITQLGTQASLASGWHGKIEALIQAYDAGHASCLVETIYAVAGEQNDSAGDGRIGAQMNTAAVDLTVDQALRVTVTPATNGGGYSYSYYGGVVEVL